MSFNTNIPGHILIGDDNIVFGTAMLGNDFGQIATCNLQRTGNKVEVENNAGGLRAVIIANPGFELDLEVQFSSDVEVPAMGDPIVFPLAGVQGRVMEGASIKWSAKGTRMLSFKASYWDSMGTPVTVDGVTTYTMPAYTVAPDGTTTTIGTAVTLPTLSGLSLSTGMLAPVFNAAVTAYAAAVSNATATITVTPTLTNPTGAVTVDGIPVASGSASGAVALNVGINHIYVTAFTPDGSIENTYTVTVTRAAA